MTEEKIHKDLNTKEQSLVEQILEDYELYKNQSSKQRNVWVDCYTSYNSLLAKRENPYLSNIFVPKTHEAVEILSAFLIGDNQLVRAKPAGVNDVLKSEPIQKLLQYQWDKVLRAREKIEVWAKEAVIFGTGIMKVGWIDDPKKKFDDPFIEVVDLPHFYADFYIQDIQEQDSVIHEIFTTKEKIKKLYKNPNVDLIEEFDTDPTSLSFQSQDASTIESKKKIRLLEYWTPENVMTIAEGKDGWVFLRKDKNPYEFIPFVVLRYKVSPLPNRFYGIGAIEPTLVIQKAINNIVNEMFDNITLINQKMWIKRRGASINPQDLVARPGGIIEVTDINQDLQPVQVSDIKASIQMLYQLLDAEFQQASGAINLLKGLPGAEFATEVALQQRNVFSLLNRVTEHFKMALSELGQMLVEVNLKNITTNRVVKILETDEEDRWLEIKPNEINGKFDIDIQVDRAMETDRTIMSKQLIDFLAVATRDENMMAKIDTTKIYKKWLELQGFADVEEFFKKKQALSPQMAQGVQEAQGVQGTHASKERISNPILLKGRELPKREEELSTRGLVKATTPI